MHLIDKDPVPRHRRLSPLNKALQNKASSKYSTNPILKMVPPKKKEEPKEVLIRTVPPERKQRMRQYGDKGYVPSNGKGVGH